MSYMNDPVEFAKTHLAVNNVVSILISSEFLQMESLLDICFDFVVRHLNQVVKQPVDLSCLSSNVLDRIARSLSERAMDSLRDKKDKIMSRLYSHKLSQLLEDDDNILYRCLYCSKLFTSPQREYMTCAHAKHFVDFHGNVIAKHTADNYWDIRRYVQYLHDDVGIAWRNLYWSMWGRIQSFHCSHCDTQFPVAEYAHCSHHPGEPVFKAGANIGVYVCLRTISSFEFFVI